MKWRSIIVYILLTKTTFLLIGTALRNDQEIRMGYGVKIQRVDRGRTKSFYVNLPAAIAEAANVVKGEEWEWLIEDRDVFVLKRKNPQKALRQKPKEPLG